MPDPVAPQVLIVGAGAAGLTLAIDLARRGVAFRIIDKGAAPFTGSRGKGIQPRSQEVLEDLGVLDKIAALGGRYPPRRAYGPHGARDMEMMEARAASPAEPYIQPLMLPQALTEGVLRERLGEFGIHVEFGAELTGFDQRNDAVSASIQTAAGGETLNLRYLVGADGGASFVRKTLGIGFPGELLPVRAVVADMVVDGLGRDAWHTWNAEDRPKMLSLCPLAGTSLFQLQAVLPLEGEADLSDANLAQMIETRTGRSDLRPKTILWRSAFQPSARLADRYRVGRVLLAGDAAHVHPPTGGQGLNTSIQDAYNLGWKLAAVLGGADEALLDTYEAERRPVAAEVLSLSTGLLRSGAVKRGRETHELDIGYFDSALALDGRDHVGRLAAGGRAPDAPLRGAAGQPIRLFEVLRGPQATLIAYEAGDTRPASTPKGLQIRRVGADGDLQDDGGHFARAYDLAPGDWVLVRPDGYVAAIASTPDAAALDEALTRMGLAA